MAAGFRSVSTLLLFEDLTLWVADAAGDRGSDDEEEDDEYEEEEADADEPTPSTWVLETLLRNGMRCDWWVVTAERCVKLVFDDEEADDEEAEADEPGPADWLRVVLDMEEFCTLSSISFLNF